MFDLQNLGLWGLFIGTFLAATGDPYGCLLVGTLGNWLGSVLTYWIGWLGRWEWLEKWFKVKPETLQKQKAKIDRYGVWLALLAWIPIVGDVLAIALGFYKVRPLWTMVLLLIGKAGRFCIWTALMNLAF